MSVSNHLAPIALFCHSRPDHLKLTVEALANNIGAGDSDLVVFSDAPGTTEKVEAVETVRKYLPKISGFRSVIIHHRAHNFGLAKSIIEGVTQVISEHERIIVLEDDMVTSPHFLTYMNKALDQFAEDERVASAHGYVYPVKRPLPEAFFLPGADCWGWATWRRAWTHFNPDGKYLLEELKRRELLTAFDFNGAYPYSKMLIGQIAGMNDSWAVRWYASAFLADKLTLYPGRSLVRNIGNDNSGTHCGNSDTFDTILSTTPIDLSSVEVCPSIAGCKAFEDFFRQPRGGWVRKAQRRVQTLVEKITP